MTLGIENSFIFLISNVNFFVAEEKNNQLFITESVFCSDYNNCLLFKGLTSIIDPAKILCVLGMSLL